MTQRELSIAFTNETQKPRILINKGKCLGAVKDSSSRVRRLKGGASSDRPLCAAAQCGCSRVALTRFAAINHSRSLTHARSASHAAAARMEKNSKPKSFSDLSTGQIRKILNEEAKSNKAIDKELKVHAQELRRQFNLLLLGTCVPAPTPVHCPALPCVAPRARVLILFYFMILNFW